MRFMLEIKVVIRYNDDNKYMLEGKYNVLL